MKNFKLLAFVAAFSAVTYTQEEVKTTQTYYASVQESFSNAYKSATTDLSDAYTSTTQALSKAANSTADYAKVSFVKAKELCNQANQKMFTVAADDNSYVAMLKNNAAQITLGTLVAAAAVVTTVYVFTNTATEEEQN